MGKALDECCCLGVWVHMVTSMDDARKRAILEEARETIERVEREQAERASQPRAEVSWTPPRTRELPPVVFKTTERPAPKAVTMDADTAKAWEKWANAIVQAKLEAFADLMGAEVGKLEQRFNTELKCLTAEIATLREDVRASVAKNITPLRPRDVA